MKELYDMLSEDERTEYRKRVIARTQWSERTFYNKIGTKKGLRKFEVIVLLKCWIEIQDMKSND